MSFANNFVKKNVSAENFKQIWMLNHPMLTQNVNAACA
jgi:hypothetical protein